MKHKESLKNGKMHLLMNSHGKKNRSVSLTAAFEKEDKPFATRNDIKYLRVPKPGNVLHKKKGFMCK